MTLDQVKTKAREAVARRDAKAKERPDAELHAWIELPGDVVDAIVKAGATGHKDLLKGLRNHADKFRKPDGTCLPATVLADQFLELIGEAAPAPVGG
jgi:hypothetical protein